ncbi:dTDP-4-dehydrorhamnose reductase [Devosia sp. SL43]|uniref:dTDP-4-dehydrorhamnose reductase n=1 Tax=Devosia sp. SL43 TaxID=2806348 RepID=UPI001F00393D|nr:dTDP-4-dehydrorhamnose reductase [Devosia sp. SL43]UJW85860.1 dTDP-4-dehydrorhamnose reductase [Devosia sp. SL43]
MRIVVTGRQGQVVSALVARPQGHEIIALGRPELDLEHPETIRPALVDSRPDVIVSSAAYTAVDKAETEPSLAFSVNAGGPRTIAAVAADMGIPIIHLSTDYVFNGRSTLAYVETDQTDPLGVYGSSKLQGEASVAAATENHAILRTAWVYSPYGANFVKTMLRLAQTRDEIRVVADQVGNPTSALDIADAVIAVAKNLKEREKDASLRGIFHMTGTGSTSWASFASKIFEVSAAMGGPTSRVVEIPSTEYPTPAPRPANSRLNCQKLRDTHGLTLPNWETSLEVVMQQLVPSVSQNV